MTTQDQQLTRRIVDAVEAGFDQQVEFTSTLVSIPSVRGSERAAQEFMAAAYREAGFEVDQWTLDPDEVAQHPGAGAVTIDYADTPVVVGTLEPAATAEGDGAVVGKSLLLNGHVDVVPEGRHETWAHQDPFSGRVQDGWLYGRGAGDMKAGLALNLWAVKALQQAGLRPASTLIMASVPEEECTGNGAISTVQRGYSAEAVLIPEPSQENLAVSCLGVIWFSVDVTGVAAHAHEMQAGFNALDASYGIIEGLRELEEEWNRLAVDEPALQGMEHPINLNVGIMHSGEWASTVPDAARFEVRVAVVPSMGREEAWRQIQERVQRSVREHPAVSGGTAVVEKTGFFSDAYRVPEGTELESVIRRSWAEASGGAELEEWNANAYIDTRVYGTYQDTPSFVLGPIAEKAHGSDERVNLESLKRVTTAYALFIARWCGVTEA